MVCIKVDGMTKPIILERREWITIRDQLHKKYPPSYFIRTKMKEKLGFTVREHQGWVENTKYHQDLAAHNAAMSNSNEMDLLLTIPPERGWTERQIHLDFFDEKKRTMFILTYIGSK